MQGDENQVKIVFHFPETERGNKELQKKIASVHAEAVKDYLTSLACSQEQKLDLIQSILEVDNSDT